uniref:Guanylate kinase n=1 Tax=Candidatus Aschnera chinzeii TaxID=1485666 RepID=A0AAT9G3T7_9ENTR|nr:MAG: guanylate kinase [Candidatus Aschnera chinzeii]
MKLHKFINIIYMIKGSIYIISAPSGAGKSSIIRAFLSAKVLQNIKVSISYTTRMMRPGEQHGKHYYFISKYKFLQMINNDVFIEYASVFGNYYGTSKILVESIIDDGIDLILDIDWQGAQQIKQKVSSVCTIFILPPTKNELVRRLYCRGQDSYKKIKVRMKHAVAEIKHYLEYDYIIINDDFNDALKNLESIIRSKRLCLNHQIERYNKLINNLLLE